MKRIINHLSCIFLLGISAFSSCKEDQALKPADTFTTKDFTYNLATRKFAPEVELNGNIKSEEGIKLIYYYLERNGSTSQLVHTAEPAAENQKDYSFTIPNAAFSQYDMTNAVGLKVMVRHLNNTSSEGFLKISSYMPEKPALTEFPERLIPNVSSGFTAITGKISAESGLAKIEVFDNYRGDFELVETIANLNEVANYVMNFNYAYKKWATKLKIVATDAAGIPGERIIELDAPFPVNKFFNVFMTAHTTGSNTIFFEKTGSTLGNCSLNASEATMAFLYYGVSSGPSFYSPTNTSTIAANLKCNGAGWVIANTASLRATRFRVLVPGTPGIDNIYAQFNANAIENIDDAFFASNSVAAPTGSTARFDPNGTATTSIFNTATAYLIYVRIPDVGSPSTYKNALIRAKEATSSTGTSTIKFDIIVQK
jgi:hypothetical protein